MLKVALRGVLARKFRLALTGTAVLLGVMFVTTTYVLTDTLDRSFQRVFSQSLADVDVVVRGEPAAGDDDPRRVPDTILGAVRAADGVAAANGFVQGYAQFLDRNGDAVDKGGPAVGVTFVGGRASGPLRLVDDGGRRSRSPAGALQVAMDLDTARAAGFHVGDEVDVLSAGPRASYELVGLFTVGDGADTGPLSFAAFDLPTSQRVAAAPGLLDAVYVRGTRGVDAATLRRSLRASLGPDFEVTDAALVARTNNQDVGEFVDLLTGLLLGFSALGLVVGGFIIFNTFTILVTQRTRELGLLRAMGAARRAGHRRGRARSRGRGRDRVRRRARGRRVRGAAADVAGRLARVPHPERRGRRAPAHRRVRVRARPPRDRRRGLVAGVPGRPHPPDGRHRRPARSAGRHLPAARAARYGTGRCERADPDRRHRPLAGG